MNINVIHLNVQMEAINLVHRIFVFNVMIHVSLAQGMATKLAKFVTLIII